MSDKKKQSPSPDPGTIKGRTLPAKKPKTTPPPPPKKKK